MVLRASAFNVACLGFANADLNALVMGDWGGIPIPPWHTPAEAETAKYMAEEQAKINASFALALGDNFYENGIGSDEFDKRFENTFEKVFTSPNLRADKFFRVLAGNHDHYGNVTAQVAYSAHSPRWHFPSLYYNFVEAIDADTTVEFVMIDTVVLSGNSRDEVTGWDLQGNEMAGPTDQEAADEEWAWLNATLAASKADFIVAAGHYPVWSICEHGPNSMLVQKLKPILELHHVSAYLSGHDHCEEHIDDSKGLGPQYHVIGAANQNQGSKKNHDKVPAEQVKFLDIGSLPGVSEVQGGFASLKFTGGIDASLTVNHFRVTPTGYKLMYTAPPIHRRKPDVPTPAPAPTPVTPTPPPTPAPPTPPKWECHKTMTFSNSIGLKNLDHSGFSSISDCEATCLKTANCSVINIHSTDKHCHTYAGAVTEGQYTGDLKKADLYETCGYF